MEKDIKALKQYLIDFLLYLNDRQLINDYDFEYEKVAIKFIKKNKNKMSREIEQSRIIDHKIHAQANEYADLVEAFEDPKRSPIIRAFKSGYIKAFESALIPKLTHTTKTPHVCPVCGGNGLVPNGFYSHTSGQWSTTNTSPETCRSCDGKGIIIL